MSANACIGGVNVPLPCATMTYARMAQCKTSDARLCSKSWCNIGKQIITGLDVR